MSFFGNGNNAEPGLEFVNSCFILSHQCKYSSKWILLQDFTNFNYMILPEPENQTAKIVKPDGSSYYRIRRRRYDKVSQKNTFLQEILIS